MKLAILALLHYEEIVKNSIEKLVFQFSFRNLSSQENVQMYLIN